MNILPLLFTTILISTSASLIASEFPPAPGKRYDIGGYSLHLNCQGKGQPTVLIDVGLGDDSSDWKTVQQAASEFSTICVYDRPGYGWSDVGPQPRNSAHIAYELEKLIEQADLPGPYVLVGHSFGGYNVRMFAANQPDKVAGMILVDASHAQQYEKLDIHLPNTVERSRNIMVMPKSTGSVSSTKIPALRERAIHAAISEITALYQSALQVQRLHNIPRVPLIVITRGKSEWYGSNDATKREKTWIALQQDLWRLSPISQHIFANRSGHDIHLEQPDIVVKAISDVINMSRVMQ